MDGALHHGCVEVWQADGTWHGAQKCPQQEAVAVILMRDHGDLGHCGGSIDRFADGLDEVYEIPEFWKYGLSTY